MAFIKTTRAAHAKGAVLEMYQHQEQHWGYVPNYAKLFSGRPEVLSRWGRLLAEIRRPVSDRLFELATFVVARELKHSSCSMAHGKILADIIGTDNVIAIAEGKTPDVLSDAEVAMMNFARDVARNAGKITSGQVEALKSLHGYTDDDVFDIAAVAAGRCFFTKLLDALGAEPDAGFRSIDARLRESFVGGRPMSLREDERLAG